MMVLMRIMKRGEMKLEVGLSWGGEVRGDEVGEKEDNHYVGNIFNCIFG